MLCVRGCSLVPPGAGADLRHMEALVAVENSARRLQLGVAGGCMRGWV